MALADSDRTWKETTIHFVISQWLRAERENFSFEPQWLPIVDNPDLANPEENHKRMRLFYIVRAIFLIEVPLDAEWYEVESLTENEFDDLYTSARHGQEWAGRKLREAAIGTAPLTLRTEPKDWARIILFGHSRTGPFSILEGNRRLIAYVQANATPQLKTKICVGISPSLCHWHLPDGGAFALGQGIFRGQGAIASLNGQPIVL
jgi:hypothetical protein